MKLPLEGMTAKRLIILLFCSIPCFAHAQFGNECFDENRVNPYFNCGPNFQPVCACDGVTYRNECLSYNAFGNNYILNSGVCPNDLFFFDMWPSLVQDNFTFYMQFAFLQRSPVTVQIISTHGDIVYTRLLTNVRDDFPYIESIFLSDIEPGVYVLVVISQGVYKYKKFVKHNF